MSTAPPGGSSSAIPLHFKRRVAPNETEPSVDWDEVARTLDQVDPDGALSDPRFDSLKYTLRLLSSVGAEKDLDELREHWTSLDAHVDSVVDVHYSEFNECMRLYSEILRRFDQMQDQMHIVRQSLEVAKTQARPEIDRLRELYRRDLMLEDMHRLLSEAMAITAVPDEIDRLIQRKEWTEAVNVLLEGCNKAAREEFDGVGALKEVKQLLATKRETLLELMTVQLEDITYRKPSPAHGLLQLSRLKSFETPRQRRVSVENESTLLLGPPQTAPRPRGPPLSSTIHDDSLLRVAENDSASVPLHRPNHRRASTYAGTLGPLGSFGRGSEGHVMDPEAPTTTLVNCMAHLGGVAGGLAVLRAHMPSKMRAALIEAIASFPRSQWIISRHKHQSSTTTGGFSGGSSVDAATAGTASSLAEAVFSRGLVVLTSVVRVLELLLSARPPVASAGLHMLVRQDAGKSHLHGANTQNGDFQELDLDPGDAISAVAAECRQAWEYLQLEFQAFVAAILGGAQPQPTYNGSGQHQERSGVASSGSGWLATMAGFDNSSKTLPYSPDAGGADGMPRRDSTNAIMFSLREEMAPKSSPTAQFTMSNPAGPNSKSETDIGSLVSTILGGREPRPELVASVYRPAMRLMHAAERLIQDAIERGKATGDGPEQPPPSTSSRLTSLLPNLSWRSTSESVSVTPAAPNGKPLDDAESPILLKAYLDNFLRLEFLPAVYVSTRSRARHILDGGDALKPRARLRGGWVQGTAMVPAAVGVVSIAESILDWASCIPPFAPHLYGVLENVLNSVLEAFQGMLSTIADRSAALTLADDVRVVQILAKEPVAPLVGSPVAFFVGAKVDAMDSFVSSAIAAGFGSSKKGLERELLAVTEMAFRPVRLEMLLSNQPSTSLIGVAGGIGGLLVHIASLAESADYIADAVASGASATAFRLQAPDGSGNTGVKSRSPRRAEAWKRHLSGLWRGQESNSDQNFAESLAHAADRFRAFAGRCIRVLRLDMFLLTVHHMELLPRLGPGDRTSADGTSAEEYIAAVGRVVGSLDEALAPYLPPQRRMYIFGTVPSLAMQIAVSMLPEFRVIDSGCVSRVCRLLSMLQPMLGALGGVNSELPVPAGGFNPMRQLEKAKLYYSLLVHTPDSLVAAVEAKPHRFSAEEYEALLDANVPGRLITKEHRQRLHAALASKGV